MLWLFASVSSAARIVRSTPSSGRRKHLSFLKISSAAEIVAFQRTAGYRLQHANDHHERRRVEHFGVTAHPTADWVAQQVREAFPWATAPQYLIRDRDGAYGQSLRSTVVALGVKEVVTAPRSPWQNPYVERLIGIVRRECLNHVIVLHERHPRRLLVSHLDYYHRSRTHLSLGKDSPDGRSVPPGGTGKIVPFAQVGGLHHRYERLAA